MKSRTNSIRTKVAAALVGALVAPALALGVVVAPNLAQAADHKANCQVHAIHLTKEGDGTVPKNLEFIEDQLADDQFAAYKGFKLLDNKSLALQGDRPGKANFSSGHKLELTLLAVEKKRLRLNVTLTDRAGQTPLLSTAYGIEDGGVFLVGGSKYKEGRLLFAIRCAGASS